MACCLERLAEHWGGLHRGQGHYVPQLAQMILDGNKPGAQQLNLKGFLLGAPAAMPPFGRCNIRFCDSARAAWFAVQVAAQVSLFWAQVSVDGASSRAVTVL